MKIFVVRRLVCLICLSFFLFLCDSTCAFSEVKNECEVRVANVDCLPHHLAIEALSSEDPLQAFSEMVGASVMITKENMAAYEATSTAKKATPFAKGMIWRINHLISVLSRDHVQLSLDGETRTFSIEYDGQKEDFYLPHDISTLTSPLKKKNLKLQIQKLVASIRSFPCSDVLPEKIEEEIRTVFPLFDQLEKRRPGKGAHVAQVVNYLVHLIYGDVDYFYRKLNMSETERREWEERGWDDAYRLKIGRIKAMFDDLPRARQDDMLFFAIIHDMGYLDYSVVKPSHHVYKGIDTVYEMLRLGGFSHEEANYWRTMVAHHADVGMLDAGEITPAFHNRITPEQRTMCFILSICDIASWVKPSKGLESNEYTAHNRVSLKILESLFEQHDPTIYSILLDEQKFFHFRLQKMGKEKLDEQLTPIQTSLMDREIDAQVSLHDWAVFKSCINNTLYVLERPLFYKTIENNDFERYVKLWKIVAFAAQYKMNSFLNGLPFFIDTDVDFSHVYDEHVAAVYQDFLEQLDAIPNDFTYEDFCNNVTHNESFIYGVPVVFESNGLTFSFLGRAKPTVISIDNPAEVGLPQLTRKLAAELDGFNLSVALLYRVAVYLAELHAADFSASAIISKISQLEIVNDSQYGCRILFEGEDVTNKANAYWQRIHFLRERVSQERSIRDAISELWVKKTQEIIDANKHVVLDVSLLSVKNRLAQYDIDSLHFIVYRGFRERVRHEVECLLRDNEHDIAHVYNVLYQGDAREERVAGSKDMIDAIVRRVEENVRNQVRHERQVSDVSANVGFMDVNSYSEDELVHKCIQTITRYDEVELFFNSFPFGVTPDLVMKFCAKQLGPFYKDKIGGWSYDRVELFVEQWGSKFDYFINQQLLSYEEKAYLSNQFRIYLLQIVFSIQGESGLRDQRLIQMLEHDGILTTETKSWGEIEKEVDEFLFSSSQDVLTDEQFARLFYEDYMPGAFRQRQNITRSFDRNYHRKMRERIIQGYADTGRLRGDRKEILSRIELYYQAIRTFYAHTKGQIPFNELSFQQAKRGFLRVINQVAIGKPDDVVNEQINLQANVAAKELAQQTLVPLLSQIESVEDPLFYSKVQEIKKMIVRIGTVFFVQNGFSIDNPEQIEKEAESILKDCALIPLELDGSQEYAKEHLIGQPAKTIAWFSDDNGDVVFALLWIQKQLELNPNLKIVIVPKDGHYDVDASTEDIDTFLLTDAQSAVPLFSSLQAARENGQFRVYTHGPRLAGFNGRELPKELAQFLIDDVDTVVGIGSSLQECANGIRKNAYFGLDAIYPLSLKLLGAERMVFYKVPAGAPSYQKVQDSGRETIQVPASPILEAHEVALAGQTVHDLLVAVHGAHYKDIFNQLGKDMESVDDVLYVNSLIKELAAEHERTFVECIYAFSDLVPFQKIESLALCVASTQVKQFDRYVLLSKSAAQNLEHLLNERRFAGGQLWSDTDLFYSHLNSIHAFIHDDVTNYPLLSQFVRLENADFSMDFNDAIRGVQAIMHAEGALPSDLRIIADDFDVMVSGVLCFSTTDERSRYVPGAEALLFPIAIQVNRHDVQNYKADDNIFYKSDNSIVKINVEYLREFSSLYNGPLITKVAAQMAAYIADVIRAEAVVETAA